MRKKSFGVARCNLLSQDGMSFARMVGTRERENIRRENEWRVKLRGIVIVDSRFLVYSAHFLLRLA